MLQVCLNLPPELSRADVGTEWAVQGHVAGLGGSPTRLGPAVLLQESHCSHIGRQHGAEEVTEEEEEAW